LANIFGTITVAVDGSDGLEKFLENNHLEREERFDLIISDINMPKMSGIEMLKSIRELQWDIPFIFITAHNEVEYFSGAIRYGVDGYLLKPMDLEQYSDVIIKTLIKIKNLYDKEAYKEELEQLNSRLEEQVKERTMQLKEKLYKDELTGTASREAFFLDLEEQEPTLTPVLFLLNINAFRIYNELYGMDVGNEILVNFSRLLERFIATGAFKLYRISGDEFLLYQAVEQCAPEHYAMRAKELLSYLSDNRVYIKSIDTYLEITVTLGISFASDNPLGKADIALNHAKKSDRAYSIYTKDMETTQQLENILYWKGEIKKALDEDRVVPYFQPIVNREQKVIKYESLMRIKQYGDNGEEQVVVPFHFLDIAIRTKQYINLSTRVIDQAIEWMSGRGISLSINIDTQDIDNEHLMSMLQHKVESFNKMKLKESDQVILEILENQEIEDYTLLKEKLTYFKEHEASIAIDDFGSGYSNFSHIIGISPKYLKIDATIIKNIVTDKNAYEIVQSIVSFAKSLGIKTIAEYVASQEIFEIVYDLGVDEFQGYHFGKPVPIEEIDL
jgi:diguanylate cyclase (GGDEF)-like protein